MRELARLRALTPFERRMLVVAIAAMPVVAAGVSILGFGPLHALMARWPRPGSVRFRPADDEAARAESLAKVVAIAAAHGPVRATCLRRSLLLWWLLRCRGIDTVLRVGVNRDSGTLQAHAWLELRGKPLNDPEDISQRFPAFARDFGAAPARIR